MKSGQEQQRRSEVRWESGGRGEEQREQERASRGEGQAEPALSRGDVTRREKLV